MGSEKGTTILGEASTLRAVPATMTVPCPGASSPRTSGSSSSGHLETMLSKSTARSGREGLVTAGSHSLSNSGAAWDL